MAVVAALAVGTASCGSGPSEAIAFDEPTDVPTSASTAVVDDAESTSAVVDVVESSGVIAFQATWLCELQRRTFPDLDAADSALNDSLGESGLDRQDYDEFLEMMAESQELRDEVLSLFSERCRA